MKTNNFAKNLLRECSHANSVAISGHRNPDYDSICSSFALQEILKQNGILADVFIDNPLDASFYQKIREKTMYTTPQKQYDVLISVDCPDIKMLPTQVLDEINAKKTFCIDHHKDNKNYMQQNFVLGGESSACEVIFNLFEKYFRLNKDLATLFYIGIYADTGGFKYSNVHSSTFLVLSKLAKIDINMDELVQDCFCKISKEGFDITRRAYDSVQFFENGQIAVSTLRLKDFEESKASYGESKKITSIIQSIDGVKVAICISEREKEQYNISLRTAVDGVDVSLIARHFNGGGHTRASGLKMVGDYNKVLGALINQSKNILGLLK